MVTVSLDFDAYFPSLDIDKCASIAKESIENSIISVNCDTKEVSLFTACSHSVKDIELAGLKDVVHRRRFKNGTRPGMTCNAITGGEKSGLKTNPGSHLLTSHPPDRQ